MPLAVQGRPRRGLVVSDLHLFARRSRGAALFGSLREKIAEVDVLVLNGDTFDFRWSTLGDQDTTIAAALDWLRAVATRHRQCEVHFTSALLELPARGGCLPQHGLGDSGSRDGIQSDFL